MRELKTKTHPKGSSIFLEVTEDDKWLLITALIDMMQKYQHFYHLYKKELQQLSNMKCWLQSQHWEEDSTTENLARLRETRNYKELSLFGGCDEEIND